MVDYLAVGIAALGLGCAAISIPHIIDTVYGMGDIAKNGENSEYLKEYESRFRFLLK